VRFFGLLDSCQPHSKIWEMVDRILCWLLRRVFPSVYEFFFVSTRSSRGRSEVDNNNNNVCVVAVKVVEAVMVVAVATSFVLYYIHTGPHSIPSYIYMRERLLGRYSRQKAKE
jgi:hypothetical protein